MLQLQSKELDICRICKLLVKYNIKASVSNQVITLEGEISDELLSKLCDGITICTVQNYSGEITTITQEESIFSTAEYASEQIEDKFLVEETKQKIACEPQIMQNDDLIYSTVKRGEVYICDFGEPYGSEQGYDRYAIVVQNDDGNLYAPTTIVLACTSAHKKNRLPTHHNFVFSNGNMVDYNVSNVGVEQNVVMAEQIRTVDKTRLRKYLGTMTPEFMNKMQEIIDISLHLTRTERVITKTEKVYVDRPVYKTVSVNSNVPKEHKDLNLVQIQLLALVEMGKLFKISQTKACDEIKTEKILQLFGFNLEKNGAKYLLKAILISPKEGYFNLETLCEEISKNEPNIEKDEIKRLIVARVKEQFKFKKSPTIDFIRLVNRFLTKKEDEQNEEVDV